MVPFVAVCAFVAFAAQLVLGDHDGGATIGARPFVLSLVALLASGTVVVRSAVGERPRRFTPIPNSAAATRLVAGAGALTFAFGIAAQFLGEGTPPDGGDAVGWLVSTVLVALVAALLAMIAFAVPALVATRAIFVARDETVRVEIREQPARRAYGNVGGRWLPGVGTRPPPARVRFTI